jgi:hypothetical protein
VGLKSKKEGKCNVTEAREMEYSMEKEENVGTVWKNGDEIMKLG